MNAAPAAEIKDARIVCFCVSALGTRMCGANSRVCISLNVLVTQPPGRERGDWQVFCSFFFFLRQKPGPPSLGGESRDEATPV